MKIPKMSEATLRRLADEDPFPVVTAGSPRLLKAAKLKLVSRSEAATVAPDSEAVQPKQRAG